MCVIRKDMKSVQDRLLTQMVSRRDAFDPSVWIRPKQLALFFCLPFILCPSLCQQNNAPLKACTSHTVWRECTMQVMLCTVWNEVFFPLWTVCTFCSKRGRSRVWREVCMRCFSPDEVRFSVKQSPTEGTSSLNKVMYFTTMMHAALST